MLNPWISPPLCVPVSRELGEILIFSCSSSCLCPLPIQNYTTNEKATVDQHFKELIRDLERQRDEVKAALDQREKIASENVKEIVDELEERAKLLREDKENREQIHQISDSVLFLQVTQTSFPCPLSLPGRDLSQRQSQRNGRCVKCVSIPQSAHPCQGFTCTFGAEEWTWPCHCFLWMAANHAQNISCPSSLLSFAANHAQNISLPLFPAFLCTFGA